MKALVTGATGFVGSRLAATLAAEGHEVRAMVRDLTRAEHLAERGYEMHEGNILQPWSLQGAGTGVDIAYYLIHSMGRGVSGDWEKRDREGAEAFARMVREEGVKRVVYLGGLGEKPKSRHLRSRHETALVLESEGPPLTYFRAAMIVGAESESYRTMRFLVERLPAMIAPSWLKTLTQPIGIDDAVAYLSQAPTVEASTGRQVQIGGPDVLSYGEMLDRMANVLGKSHPPKLPVPFLTPRLSSMWIGLVTPVDAGVARPLVEGLSTPTIVTDDSGMALFDVRPAPFDETLRKARTEELAGRAQLVAP